MIMIMVELNFLYKKMTLARLKRNKILALMHIAMKNK